MKIIYSKDVEGKTFPIIGHRKMNDYDYGFCSYPYHDMDIDFKIGLIEFECYDEETGENFILRA